MTETREQAIARRAETRRIEAISSNAFTAGVEAWSRIHQLTVRVGGHDWCGHNLLGRRTNYEHRVDCLTFGPSSWWDHVHRFGIGRRQVIIAGWPYGTHDRIAEHVSAYAEPFGLQWLVGDPRGLTSFYYWGATVPWFIAAPDVNIDRFLIDTSPELDAAMVQAQAYSQARQDRANASKT